MKRISLGIALVCLLLICSVSTLPQSNTSRSASPQESYVDVGGHKLRLQVAGSGTPTVVLDSGMGDSLESWRDVFPTIAGFTRVVAYDRAGLGRSDPGPEPRSYLRVATDLHALLERANLKPPYVLVGHSLGGAHIRAFAHLFKDQVAGVVFVDPLSETFPAPGDPVLQKVMEQQDSAMKGAPPGPRSEWAFTGAQALQGFPELRSFRPPPDVPMALLVAGRNRAPGWVKALLAHYGTWIGDATEGHLVVTPDSGHYIQREDPALVVTAIRRVVFPSVQNALARLIKDKGVGTAVTAYREMKGRYPADSFKERILNVLGYQELRARRVDNAIALLGLNVEMYPESSNPYDSLAEAYMVKGDRQAAIDNYRKSLALNPGNTNATAMLKKLQDERK